MNCDSVMFQAVTYHAHTCVSKLPIVLCVSDKGVEGGLAVVPVKALGSILNYEAVVFCKVEDQQGFMGLNEGFP